MGSRGFPQILNQHIFRCFRLASPIKYEFKSNREFQNDKLSHPNNCKLMEKTIKIDLRMKSATFQTSIQSS